jgi:hypothetical protein
MLLFAGISAFAVFLGIASIGFLILVVSFASGELLGHGDLSGHDADFHGDVHGGAGVSGSPKLDARRVLAQVLLGKLEVVPLLR